MLHQNEIVVDSFAGGGGASTGIERALGRPVDYAINHDPEAIAMHLANHPYTQHFVQNVWQVDPRDIAQKRPVGLAWFSPDCKHFSKAKGGQPVKRNIRDLAWVVVHHAELVRPRVIMLENVEEFEGWGPLVEVDGKLLPCPERKGDHFKRWVRRLRQIGYKVQWRTLRASKYGAPTSRNRLFLVARCDGLPIVWPDETHGPDLLPYRAAAECIDWTLPCPSIFDRARPLADNTMRRIAAGVQRYVIDAAEPFIVPVTHGGDDRVHGIGEPLRTITCAPRGEHALVTAFLAQHNTGMVGRSAMRPLSAITQRGTQQQIVTSHLVKLRNNCYGQPMTEPLDTICANGKGGGHFGEVRAFLIKYHRDGGQHADCGKPMPTIPCRDSLGLVVVRGELYRIEDIGMRMLTPRELFRAQGFPDSYIIDPLYQGKPLTKTAQIRMCGNSVCPDVAAALVHANLAQAELRVVAGAAAE